MLLSYRDPQFWKKFHARHWEPRVPTVIRQPFKQFPFTEDGLLRAMKRFAAGLKNGDHRIPCLVSVGDKVTAPRRPIRDLFDEENRTLADLEKNCARLFSNKNFGLMITRMQAVDPEIFGGLAAFLQDGRRFIDFPVQRAFLDLFYGSYSTTFTGVHKDTQEIFAFVVRGEKRILAWPFDYFLKRVKGVGPGDRFFNKRLSIDPRKYRKDAIVLDAKAGDVLHWSSDYWHVAEAQPGKFSALLSMGLFRPDGLQALLAQKKSPFSEKFLSADSETPRSQDMSSVVKRPGTAGQLRWATGFGFELGGPVEDELEPHGKISVVKKKNSVILWSVEGRRLLVSTNGHSATLPLTPKAKRLLERIAQGKPVAEDDNKIVETFWNKRRELKTRKAGSLVDWLLRVHAVERN